MDEHFYTINHPERLTEAEWQAVRDELTERDERALLSYLSSLRALYAHL